MALLACWHSQGFQTHCHRCIEPAAAAEGRHASRCDSPTPQRAAVSGHIAAYLGDAAFEFVAVY